MSAAEVTPDLFICDVVTQPAVTRLLGLLQRGDKARTNSRYRVTQTHLANVTHTHLANVTHTRRPARQRRARQRRCPTTTCARSRPRS